MKRLWVVALVVALCGVLVPKCVFSDEEGEADTAKEELQQK
jgi:hypothetical protein